MDVKFYQYTEVLFLSVFVPSSQVFDPSPILGMKADQVNHSLSVQVTSHSCCCCCENRK